MSTNGEITKKLELHGVSTNLNKTPTVPSPKIKRIFLTGLTSVALGGMEYHNLGNYVIMEPLVLNIHNKFPTAQIRTSIQMSERFCQQFDVVCLKNPRLWFYGTRHLPFRFLDLFDALLWRVLKSCRIKVDRLLQMGELLNEFREADLVLDFSGDLYGDNSHWARFIQANARLVISIILGKPTCMIASSPGPFKRRWRLMLAKLILPRLSLVTNREPMSTTMLASYGIKADTIITTACPSVLFQKKNDGQTQSIIEKEGINNKPRPLVGLIICGWNMCQGPYNKWPRYEDEYKPFIELIEYMLCQLGLNVCVMSHQNATDSHLNLIPGNDHRIIAQLFDIIGDRYKDDRLFTLKHLYDASTSKTIISKFDVLISGRIHGAIQGLSQCIPTAIIDYGHEPKAHKLRGFAQLYGVENYIADPNDISSLKDVVRRLWADRESVKKMLIQKVPEIRYQALRSFELLEEVYLNDTKGT